VTSWRDFKLNDVLRFCCIANFVLPWLHNGIHKA